METKMSYTQSFREAADAILERSKAKAQQAEDTLKEPAGKATDNTKLKAE